MKNFFPIILLAFCLISVSCDVHNTSYGTETSIVGTFVMNQGDANVDGSVTHYHADTLTNGLFNEVNNRSLMGEMISASFGSDKGYFLMSETGSNSSAVEKVNLDDFKSEMTSSPLDNVTDLFCVSDTFVYATVAAADGISSGELLKLDATTLSVIDRLKVGVNPTKIAYDRGKLVYVANTGDIENSIMIVDLVANEAIDTVKIETLVNPVDMVIDTHSNLWILCEGEGETPKANAGLVRISYGTNEQNERVVTNYPFTDGYYGKGRGGLSISLGGVTVYYINDGAYRLSVVESDLTYKTEMFAEDRYKNVVFDALSVSSRSGQFFCTKSDEDKVYVFDSYGLNEEDKYIEVGANPGKCLFR